MSTTNNNTANYTVENLVAKYRDYVKEHCPKTVDLCEGKDGKLVEVLTPMPPYSNVGEQLLVILYKATTANNADKRILDALSEYEQVFYKEALTEDEFTYLCEHYIEVVSFLFLHRDEWNVMGKELKHGISKERLRLVHEYIKPQEGARIFIADTEYCDLAVQFPNCIVEGFTGWNYKQKEVWALGEIRMAAFGIKSEIVSGEEEDDTYTYTLPEKGSVDVVIFRVNENKYFAQKIFGTECTNIEALYDLLKPGGQMLFFSEIESEMAGNGREIEFISFRKRIVNDKAISSIVSYEDSSLIGRGKSSYIMLGLTKSANKTVNIKDDIKSYTKVVSVDLIDSDILWPSFYMMKRPSDGMPLSSIAELLPEENLATFVEGEGFVLPESAKDMLLVLPNMFGDCYKDANLWHKPSYNVNDPVFEENDWIDFKLAKQPCILLSSNKETLKVGYTTGCPREGFAYMARYGLVPKDGIDLRYLAALLFEPSVKEQILTICDGSVSHYTMSLILDKILIPDHNEMEQMKFLAEANYEAWGATQEEMKKEHENYTKAVRMRKHSLSQSVLAMKSTFSALNKYRVRNNGIIKDNDAISPVAEITAGNTFALLLKDLDDMGIKVDHIADVEYTFNSPEWIDPEKYIEDYVAKNQNGWLTFRPVLAWTPGNNVAKNNMQDTTSGKIIKKGNSINTFLFPKDALDKIFNNIVSNAMAYGFTDNQRSDYILRFSWHFDGIALAIIIENNGTPIPSDRDTASLLEYGVSSALNKDGHNGIGCSEIREIMSEYDGNVRIVSSPEEHFTVKYILTFERCNCIEEQSLQIIDDEKK